MTRNMTQLNSEVVQFTWNFFDFKLGDIGNLRTENNYV